VPFLTGKEAAVSEIQNGTEKRPLECRTYTVNDIAVILGVSQARAYRLVREDLFKSVRIGNAIRISKRSFDKWLEPLDL
jgi:excisionase family DNA binding protein